MREQFKISVCYKNDRNQVFSCYLMSYFDVKQKHHTDMLNLIDKTIASGGNIKDVRKSVII